MTDPSDAAPTLAAILTEHGPASQDDIADRLHEAGIADPDTVIDELLDEFSCPARPLPDGRWVWLPAVLAGRVFTHRLTAEELTHDLLAVSPDLDPITELCDDDYPELADGSPVSLVLPRYDDELLEERGIPLELVDEPGALLLAPGTLAGLGLAAGDLLGMRLTDKGIALEPVTATTDPTLGDRLAALVDVDESPSRFASVVWAACAVDPALFNTPLAPLGEIADAHGLARSGDWLAPAGFDFDRWRFERKCARLADEYGLDDDDAFVLTTLVEIHGQMARIFDMAPDAEDDEEGAADAPTDAWPADGPYADILGELGAALANPVLALSLMEEATHEGRRGAAALGILAESLQPKVPRSARVATHWLQAMACEGLGDVAGCERELSAAESSDPDWPLALLSLARIASDRGDAEAGLGLLRRAGVGSDHPLVRLLEQHRAQPRTDVGRNEPCWCGSGRKYKKCHLGNEQLSLTERVRWLYAKAHQQVLGGEWGDLLMLAGYERIRYFEDEVDDLVAAAKTDPLAIDTMLFEGGAFAEFLELRGELLPDDERQLAEQWLGVPRSVFEVEQVRPGHGVTVRDVRTDEVFDVTERRRALQSGQLICSRALPTGDGFAFFGGIDPVAPQERDELLALLDDEPDPMELVGFLSRWLAPSELDDEYGDPLGTARAD
ncbi:SEC-C domain-containing protein [Mycolicibacter algericus]|uniref:SEC-C domain-containing protein n=1 Tax=Mycolicibacter algericus TaxID=1288388 RepID=UPI003C77FF06